MRHFKHILITGGAGFIGSNFIHYLLEKSNYTGEIVNLDTLTYAGNLNNLSGINSDRYVFEKGDICNKNLVQAVFEKYSIDCVVHFAAESHVDRSIHGPADFINTNIIGTFSLLETARQFWKERDDVLFHHISTDEVYGSLENTGEFFETTPYDPRSPYSASKASSDHIVRAYHHTYGLPVTVSNCSNNYGPYQFPEKLIPLMILNILNEKPLPVYGDGLNIRDWLYVKDHCSAIYSIISSGAPGNTWNIGGDNEWTNIRLVEKLCNIVSEKTGKPGENARKRITFIKDRPGHDRRYAINCEKLKTDFNWTQSVSFEEGLNKTVDWYLENIKWIERIQTGAYRNWIENNYSNR